MLTSILDALRVPLGVAEIKVVRKLMVQKFGRAIAVAFIEKPDFDAYYGLDGKVSALEFRHCETVRISLEFS